MSKQKIKYPDSWEIKIEADGLVTYYGKPLGQVLPTGVKFNNGREQMWTNNHGGFCYSPMGAAYELAERFVNKLRH